MKRVVSAAIASAATVILMIGLGVRPDVYTDAVYRGVLIWATKVLPAMLPYFILTRTLTSLGYLPALSRTLSPLTGALYRVNGAGGYAYLMSVISGYPVGARVTLDLYRSGALDRSAATRVATFTSTSGPLFVLGTVATMFGSLKIGAVILAAHLAAAALNGLLYRRYGTSAPSVFSSSPPPREDAVYSSVLSVLTVGGYIAIFFVIATFLQRTGLLYPVEWLLEKLCGACGLPKGFGQAVASGLVEVTLGCFNLSPFASAFPLAVAVAGCALISFGGACIQMQGWTYLKDAGVNGKIFFLSKVTHTVLSVVLCLGLGCLVIA